MRTKLGTMLILSLMLVSLFSVGGEAAVSYKLGVSVLRYEPDPAEQGNTFDVWVQLSNRGVKIDDVSIKFIPEYPFTLAGDDDEESEEIYVGSIAALEEKVIKFNILVDPNAPNGDRDITFAYRHSGSDEWILEETPIRIQTQDSVLVIEDYRINPDPVSPGQIFDLDFNLRNAGRIAIKNVDVELDITDNSFSSIGSGTQKRVAYIGPGEVSNVHFSLASNTNTEVRIHTLPIELSFDDEKNKEYTGSAMIAMQVNAEPEISVLIDNTEFSSKTKPGTVSITVVNKGVIDMKYLTAKLLPSDDYKILSPSSEEYIGNLDSDDFETVDFIIDPEVKEPVLKIDLEFKDQYNDDFVKNYEIPLKIITDSDLGKGGSPIVPIIVILLIGGGVYYWWRKKKKKNKN